MMRTGWDGDDDVVDKQEKKDLKKISCIAYWTFDDDDSSLLESAQYPLYLSIQELNSCTIQMYI